MPLPRLLAVSIAAALGFGAGPVAAQASAGPQPLAREHLPTPRDRPFRGTIMLAVDATDTQHGILATHETIPVQAPGDMVFLYPEWESASHAPTVPVAALAGLRIEIDGRRVAWRRDPYDIHAFHIAVPAGARRVTVDLQYLADRRGMRDGLLGISWQRALLYPAGWFARNIPVAASLRLPTGLSAATALDPLPSDGATLRFTPVSLERLVDTPVFAASAMRRIALGPDETNPVWLDLLSDDAGNVAIGDTSRDALRRLIVQTRRVFGPPPFRRYHAIVLLDDAQGPGGVEHLEEGENDLPAAYFRDPTQQLGNHDLIAHELVHAWNGRFRQPTDLWTPAFNEPVGGSLLWVYEGQTEYWGRILAARAGLRTVQETLDRLALDAALAANRPGRVWKSLADSTNDAIYMAGHRVEWRDWQRREDYYPEGVLLWLDVDARMRERSGGRRGLDDLAARFFHAARPDGIVSTYTFDDVCRTLDSIVPDDWAGFLRRHLDTHDDADALAGLARAGWRLVYTAEPTETFRQNEAEGGGIDLTYAIGAVIGEDGRAADIAWDGPAFRAGFVPGTRIVSVAGAPFSAEALRQAVANTPHAPLRLELADGAAHRTVTLDYRGGLRYPRLERIAGRPDRLTPSLAAK